MVFVNTGVTNIRDYLRGESATPPTYIAVGDDNTDPVKGDIALTNELSRKVIATRNYTSNTIIYTMLLSSSEENGKELKEAGLFNASTSGIMFDRFIHTTIPKNTSTEVQYKITLTIEN